MDDTHKAEDVNSGGRFSKWTFALIVFFSIIVVFFIINGWGGTLGGVLLWVLGFIIILASIIVGVFLILRSYLSSGRGYQEFSQELTTLVNETAFDVSEEILLWDQAQYSKDLAVKLEEHPGQVSELNQRLHNVHAELTNASTFKHQVDAVLAAQYILERSRYLKS